MELEDQKWKNVNDTTAPKEQEDSVTITILPNGYFIEVIPPHTYT